eukprot:g45180.t1
MSEGAGKADKPISTQDAFDMGEMGDSLEDQELADGWKEATRKEKEKNKTKGDKDHATGNIKSLDDLKKSSKNKPNGEGKKELAPKAEKTFKETDLREYDGNKDPKKPIYLCVKGLVFDVTSSGKYAPDAAYTELAGRDSSRALALGKTEIKETRLDDLDKDAKKSLDEWMKFYWEKYPCVGYIPDHFCLKQKDKQACEWLALAKEGKQEIEDDEEDDEETEAYGDQPGPDIAGMRKRD